MGQNSTFGYRYWASLTSGDTRRRSPYERDREYYGFGRRYCAALLGVPLPKRVGAENKQHAVEQFSASWVSAVVNGNTSSIIDDDLQIVMAQPMDRLEVDDRPPVLRLPDAFWALIATCGVLLTLLILIQGTIILPLPVCILLTISCPYAAALAKRQVRRFREEVGQELRPKVRIAVTLVVVGMVGLSMVFWVARFSAPSIREQVGVSQLSEAEHGTLSRLKAAAAAAGQDLLKHESDARIAEANAQQAQARYEQAASEAQCELDGTCGTHEPGDGESYKQKQAVADAARIERDQTRTAVRNQSAQVSAARDRVAEKQAQYLAASREIYERAAQSGSNILVAEIGSLASRLFQAPFGAFFLVVLIAISLWTARYLKTM